MKLHRKQVEDLTKKLKSKSYEDHRWPVSRRDFLKLGLIEFAALSMMPAMNMAEAAQKIKGSPQKILRGPAAAVDSLLPLLVFDLAGGASLSGNFVVGHQITSAREMDLLSSYSTLGWAPEKNNLDTRFGLPMVENSGIREGMLSVWNAEQQNDFSKKLRFFSICNSSLDDSSANQLSIAALAYQSGRRGQYVSEFTGTTKSSSGGNSKAYYGDRYQSVFVDDAEALSNLLGLAKSMYASASLPQQDDLKRLMLEGTGGLASAGVDISQLQKSFAAYGVPNQNLNPRRNPIAQVIYGNNQSSRNAVVSTIVMNAILGYAGPGVISIGGCDYHDDTQQTGDTKDREIGVELGRALLFASMANKPLFIQIITDGGISAKEGTRNWQSDSKDRSLTVLAVFDPKGAPDLSHLQVGSYTKGQIVDSATFVGASVENATSVAFLNYLAASKVSIEEAKFFNFNSLGASKIEDQIVFRGAK